MKENEMRKQMSKYAAEVAYEELTAILSRKGWRNIDKPRAQEFFNRVMRDDILKTPLAKIPTTAKKSARQLAAVCVSARIRKEVESEKRDEFASMLAAREVQLYGLIVENGQQILLN